MGAQVRMTTIGERSARMRLGVARTVLALGWVALVASLPMGMVADELAYPWGGAKVYSTWEVITTPYLMFFTIPLFLGLAGGTLAGSIRSDLTRSWPLWVCRFATIGLLCENLVAGVVYLIALLYQPHVGTTNADRALNASTGGGFGGLFLVIGSLFVGLSAWISPVRAGSGGKNGKQSTVSDPKPDSATGGT